MISSVSEEYFWIFFKLLAAAAAGLTGIAPAVPEIVAVAL